MVKFINFIKLVKSYFAISFLLVIFLASSWYLFQPGFFRTHDFVHGVRVAEMTRALQDGHFPVRWSENFGFGLGMPLFEFYAPLPFYVGALFYWLGADLILTTKILFLICNIFTLLGAYKLGKELFGTRAGIITSAAFTLSPYRAVNLFIRGALSEAWGIMALPWILYGIVRIIEKDDRKGFFTMVLGLVVLMLSHNLTTLMFVPLSVVFGMVLLFVNPKNRVKVKEKLLKLGGGYLLAGGLSSFYMLPAFTEKSFTQIETILGGYFHYSNHFLYIRQFVIPNWGFGGSAWGPNDDVSFFLGYGQLIAIFISILAFLFYAKKKQVFTKENFANYLRFSNSDFKLYLYPTLVFLTATSLFMTLLKSQWLWDNLPLLNFIQFPWRFIAVSIIFISLIVALNIKLIPHIVTRFAYFLVIFWVIVLGNFYYFRPERMLDDPTILYYEDEERVSLHMSDILRDYVPEQMSLNGNELKEIYQNFELPSDTQVLVDKTQEKLYQFNLETELAVEFPIANFPGWTAEIDGEKTSVTSSNNGLVTVTVPQGRHQVGITFGYSQIRAIADLISLTSLVVLIGLAWNSRKPKNDTFFRIN